MLVNPAVCAVPSTHKVNRPGFRGTSILTESTWRRRAASAAAVIAYPPTIESESNRTHRKAAGIDRTAVPRSRNVRGSTAMPSQRDERRNMTIGLQGRGGAGRGDDKVPPAMMRVHDGQVGA